MDALLTIFWGLVVLIVLVLVHELGHFIVARLFGVRVTEFMIGLPGPNIGFEHNGCRYGITCIPLGGYNRITGMEGGPEDPNLEQVLAYVYRHGTADAEHVALACGLSEEDAEFSLFVLDEWGSINKPGRSNNLGKYAAPKADGYELGEPRQVDNPKALLDSERKQTYRGLGFLKRLAVLFAGPLMNVLLAVILFLVIFCGIGLAYGTNVIDSVVEDGPAAQAGLESGDVITGINDMTVESLSSLSSALQGLQVGDEVTVSYQRDGVDGQVSLKVAEGTDGSPIIGIYAATGRYRLSVPDALYSSWQMLAMTVSSYASLLNPSTASETLSQSTSIVGISVMAKQAAGTGLINFLYLMAVISLSLGIINLFPVPPLDGGKIIVEFIEKIAGRPVPVRVINAITVVFIVLMLLLFLYMTRQDITRFIIDGVSIFG